MQYRRILIPGASYFFTINLKNRKSNLLINHIKKLRAAFILVKHQHPFTIDAIVILPDHLHLVMTLPENDSNYSQRINLIKGIFTKQIHSFESASPHMINRREKNIWQKRFWVHCIRNEKDYINHVNYIHYNPVKHDYVTDSTDWKYSSIHRYIKLDILPPNWAVEPEHCHSIRE